MRAERNSLLALPVLALVGALSLAGIHLATASRIDANRQRAADRIVLDALSLPADTELRAIDAPKRILLARQGRQLVAIVVPVAAAGYVAPIELIVGIAPDGRVRGVRVIAHRETAGLGDRIDADKGDWVRQFIGRTLDMENEKAWDVRSAGGDFDQITGATVTSRAVIEAVHGALRYFAEHRETLLREAAHD